MLQRPTGEMQSPAPPTHSADEDEVRLMDLVAGGNLHAFETLYHGYHPRLSRFVERLTRRPQIVGEVLNDTMLVVWNKASSYNRQSKVSTWIFAIAYRKALKALKQQDEPQDADTDSLYIESAPGPEQAMAQRQLQAILTSALARLPFEQRAVVDLTYFHGMGYREIADVMACPVDTVKTRMFHARHRLKALLAGQQEDLP